MKLEGKFGVVTGAARGIGEAIALRLLQDGISGLAVIDINLQSAEEAARRIDPEGTRAFAYACNVADFDFVSQTFKSIEEKYGKIDILVNNAGITRDAQFHKMTMDQWNSVINVNLNGVANCCKAVIDGMRERKYGKIVNLASVSAFGNFGQTNYGATKAAVIGFSKCLAKESAKYNITVNAIAPSYVNTDMLRAVPDEVMKKFIDAIPARRLAEPSEIASVAAFLACDDSSFVTGECIVTSGGSYM
jgi:Dehydrogenases with different specificities (related to short-chain alcohol dehydrogenases)